MRVIGLMSGTSADGTDAVLLNLEGSPPYLKWQVMQHVNLPHPAALRTEILAGTDPHTSTVNQLCALNASLGEAFARAALAVIDAAGLKAEDIDLIGSHGQTMWHSPLGSSFRVLRDPPSTLQLGEAAIIAERTGITTISNFRARDMAAGGQGAPLVAFGDALFFTDPTLRRACQNIGGIANVTWLPTPRTGVPFAFDTGPGNMLIDGAIRRITHGAQDCDLDGERAARGHIDESLLAQWMANEPYFQQAPPKTTGRELFGAAYEEQLWQQAQRLGLDEADYLGTLTALTARSIACAYRNFLPAMPDEMILSGGGARNPTLMKMLAAELAPARLRTSDELGLQSEAKEAALFALLAYETWHGRPSNLPAATGAKHAVVLGDITLGGERGFGDRGLANETTHASLDTESTNPASQALDAMTPLEIATLMNTENAHVTAAVEDALPVIATAIQEIAARMRSGGRLIYTGAGTSGRLGVLDASECPPTFGVSPDLVVGIIAGGEKALRFSVEGAEDDRDQAMRDLQAINLQPADSLVGISASGTAPYVLAGLNYACQLGALTIAIACNRPAPICETAEIGIHVLTGAEVLAGSTRLKAGTAQKMVLNMLSTGVMVQLGKVRGNRMVDMRPLNAKLRLRAIRMVMEACGVSEDEATQRLEKSAWDIRKAIYGPSLLSSRH
jgi:anhydro-N-acetylmuramic acid kinase